MSRRPNWSSCENASTTPTNNSPHTRSLNRGAAAGSVEDVYKYMPWRAPGTAVPADPCGVAGGDQHGVRQAAGGEYFPTVHAKLGDKGSRVLPPSFSGADWKAGAVVNASWFIQVRSAYGRTRPHMAAPGRSCPLPGASTSRATKTRRFLSVLCYRPTTQEGIIIDCAVQTRLAG